VEEKVEVFDVGEHPRDNFQVLKTAQ